MGDGADGRGDGHLVVVEDDGEVDAFEVAGVVEGFEGHAGGECAVADDGDGVLVAPLLAGGESHAEGGSDGGGGVGGAEGVVFAFVAAGEAGETTVLAEGGHAGAAAGEDFVVVTLVADVPDEGVVGGVEDVVQGDGQLDRAEVGGEVAAGAGDGFNEVGAQFLGKLGELGAGELAQVGGGGDGVEQGRGGGHGDGGRSVAAAGDEVEDFAEAAGTGTERVEGGAGVGEQLVGKAAGFGEAE